MPCKEDFNKYRFYNCVLKPLEYKCDCTQIISEDDDTFSFNDINKNKSEFSKLVFISKYIPHIPFIEKKIIEYKMLPRINKVTINNQNK
jgi:hypothetical protein